MINGTEITYKEFLDEYRDENNKDKTVEIVNPDTNKITELSQKEFKEMIKDENSTT